MSTNKQITHIVSLYIPRLLGNVKQQQIKNAFHDLNIGEVFYIDMYNRVNENNNHYHFAFLSINLYGTQYAKSFYNNLISSGKTRLTYDERKQQYWEVKLHVDKNLRTKEICSKEDKPKQKLIPQDTQDYKKGLEEEYDELQKEIFYITLQI